MYAGGLTERDRMELVLLQEQEKLSRGKLKGKIRRTINERKKKFVPCANIIN